MDPTFQTSPASNNFSMVNLPYVVFDFSTKAEFLFTSPRPSRFASQDETSRKLFSLLIHNNSRKINPIPIR